jgi:hypothetical protein
MGFWGTQSVEDGGGIGPVVGDGFGKDEGLVKLPSGKGEVGIGAGEMGESSNQIQVGMLGNKRDKFLEFRQAGSQSVHSGVELDLGESRFAGLSGDLGEFVGLGHGGEGDGQPVL